MFPTPTKKMLGKQFVNVDNMRSMYGEKNRYSVIQKLGQSYLLSTYLDEDTGWTIVEEIPTDAIFGGAEPGLYDPGGRGAGRAGGGAGGSAVYVRPHFPPAHRA